MLCLQAPPRPALPQVSDTLIRLLLAKQEAHDDVAVAPVWRRLIRDELRRATRNLDSLLPRERYYACLLLDWYLAADCDNCDEAWLQLYRPEERERRSTRAMLFYYARHVDELSFRERVKVMDVCDDYFARFGEFCSAWSKLY